MYPWADILDNVVSDKIAGYGTVYWENEPMSSFHIILSDIPKWYISWYIVYSGWYLEQRSKFHFNWALKNILLVLPGTLYLCKWTICKIRRSLAWAAAGPLFLGLDLVVHEVVVIHHLSLSLIFSWFLSSACFIYYILHAIQMATCFKFSRMLTVLCSRYFPLVKFNKDVYVFAILSIYRHHPCTLSVSNLLLECFFPIYQPYQYSFLDLYLQKWWS